MHIHTFNEIRRIVHTHAGISLSDRKQAMVSARVGRRIRALNLRDIRAYVSYLKSDTSGTELRHLLDAISTNVTQFFREPSHFDTIDAHIRRAIQSGRRVFRLWSAACATGEEAYSLAIVVNELMSVHDLDVRILCTDISCNALARAMRGRYPGEKLAHVPRVLRLKYFRRIGKRRADMWSARDELRRLLVFRRMNLAAPPFPMHGPFDIVMLRNVMIYFDTGTRTELLEEVHRLVDDRGLLMVGHAESLTGIVAPFRSVGVATYEKA